eukprot:COSAG01_NODE_2887_length_6910_cov_1.945236_3_plen_59_part_00
MAVAATDPSSNKQPSYLGYGSLELTTSIKGYGRLKPSSALAAPGCCSALRSRHSRRIR